MGNHRTLPYSGLHFSKNAPSSGIGPTLIAVAFSLVAALCALVAVYVIVMAAGLPMRVTGDGSSLHAVLASVIGGLWN